MCSGVMTKTLISLALLMAAQSRSVSRHREGEYWRQIQRVSSVFLQRSFVPGSGVAAVLPTTLPLRSCTCGPRTWWGKSLQITASCACQTKGLFFKAKYKRTNQKNVGRRCFDLTVTSVSDRNTRKPVRSEELKSH